MPTFEEFPFKMYVQNLLLADLWMDVWDENNVTPQGGFLQQILMIPRL
jgi:hypothetical protein